MITTGNTIGGQTPPDRRNRIPWLIRLACFMVMVTGVILAGQGLYIPLKGWVAQGLLERAFIQAQSSGTPIRPWPWADSWPMAKITIPRLEESQIVLSGGTGQALAFGPTLLPQSAALFKAGTAVLAGHRDTHFRFLKDLEPDDLILLEDTAGHLQPYRVSNRYVVHKDAFSVPNQAGTSTIVLTTCWPFDALTQGPWRYVVTAQAVPF